MKLYDFLEETPQTIGDFKRQDYSSSWKENYKFSIRSQKEKQFFIELDGCYDSILWYENKQNAYELFGHYTDNQLQFTIMEYKVTGDESEPYIDDCTYDIAAKTVKTAVNKFLAFLNNQ